MDENYKDEHNVAADIVYEMTNNTEKLDLF